jgi:hypothetical protein
VVGFLGSLYPRPSFSVNGGGDAPLETVWKQVLHVPGKHVIMRGRMSPGSCSGGSCLVADSDYVAIFNSIHRVMRAEKILKSKQARILLIPVPRQLTSDCGLAIRYAAEDRGTVEGLLAEADLLPTEVFCKKGESFVRC